MKDEMNVSLLDSVNSAVDLKCGNNGKNVNCSNSNTNSNYDYSF